MEKWGTLSIPAIAKNLNRTVNSIKIRASRLHLGPVLMGGEYVTFNQLMLALTGGAHSYTYQKESRVKKRGLPIHTKKVVENSFKVVYLDEFWEWAEKNRSFIDFSKMEPLALGAEPDWVAQQRRIDRISYANQRKDPWTQQEDQRLEFLLKQHKYTYAEVSRDLCRSTGAIQRRCCDLGLKERPVRESPHNPWSDADLQLMANIIRKGCSYAMIGEACGGRSEKAVRGIVFSKYHTENADKVRAMLSDGPWGTGAPEPTVKSEKHKAPVKKLTAHLCGLLITLRNSMDFGEYWQKDIQMDGEMTPEEQSEALRTYENDILGGLLAAAAFREDSDETKTVEIARNGIVFFKFRIRPLSEGEYNGCKERYTKYIRNKQFGVRIPEKTDTTSYRSALIYEATVKEDREKLWDNREAWRRLDVLSGVELIGRVLKAGEKDAVLDLIDKISGYTALEEDTVRD